MFKSKESKRIQNVHIARGRHYQRERASEKLDIEGHYYYYCNHSLFIRNTIKSGICPTSFFKMPHVHVLHVDGGILENHDATSSSSSATLSGTGGNSNNATTSTNASTSNMTINNTLNNSTSNNNNSSGSSSSFVGVSNPLISNPLSSNSSSNSGSLNNSLTFDNPINIISRTTSSVSASLSNQIGSGGGGSNSSSSTTTSSNTSNSAAAATKLYSVNPLSPPAISGIGCAPLQDENPVGGGPNATTKSTKLNINSIISNSNVSNRKGNFGHHRYVCNAEMYFVTFVIDSYLVTNELLHHCTYLLTKMFMSFMALFHYYS